VSRVNETIKSREIAKQAKYLKVAKRFLDEAVSRDSRKPDEEHGENEKGKSSPRG